MSMVFVVLVLNLNPCIDAALSEKAESSQGLTPQSKVLSVLKMSPTDP